MIKLIWLCRILLSGIDIVSFRHVCFLPAALALALAFSILAYLFGRYYHRSHLSIFIFKLLMLGLSISLRKSSWLICVDTLL